eukprot:1431972-Alexandrium_andersonii.AAC.1
MEATAGGTLVVDIGQSDAECRVELLGHLKGRGLASRLDSEREPRSRFQEWRLTDLGKQRLRSFLRLTSPAALVSPRPDQALSEKSIWEIVCSLHMSGWEHAVRSSRVRPDPYDLGLPKVWYTKPLASSIMKQYLLALASEKCPVPHFASAATYAALLAGEEGSARQRRQKGKVFQLVVAAEDDLDAGMVADIAKHPAKHKRRPREHGTSQDQVGWRKVLASSESESSESAPSSRAESPPPAVVEQDSLVVGSSPPTPQHRCRESSSDSSSST